MAAVATLIIVMFLSLLTVRVAAEALILTGMSRQAARFQARSAWTGTGFTTAEAEQVVNNPVRRKIISDLMFLRSVGVITAASTLMLSFVNVDGRGDGWLRLAVLAIAVVALWFVATSDVVSNWLSKVIVMALKRFTDLDTRDYAGLLHLAGEYGILELKVRDQTWMSGRRLAELRLPDEGILILGIVRLDGAYLGAPEGETKVNAGDTLVLYGRSPLLAELGKRPEGPAGQMEHARSVAVEPKGDDSEAG